MCGSMDIHIKIVTRIIGKTQVISNQKGKIRDNVNDYKKNCLIRNLNFLF